MGGGFVLWCPAIREGVVLIYRISVVLSTKLSQASSDGCQWPGLRKSRGTQQYTLLNSSP